MNIMILFGTESGNAELISSEIAEAINGRYTVFMRDMSDVDPAELSRDDFHLVVCSTHGEGELPSGAVPFATALMGAKPDLRELRYAMFGLGTVAMTITRAAAMWLMSCFARMAPNAMDHSAGTMPQAKTTPSNLARNGRMRC